MQLRRAELTPKLVDSLYVEAMVLADEARSYFDIGDDATTGSRSIRSTRVGFACKSLKVTTRLMHVIAWLLTQRAVRPGELSPAQARHARPPARRRAADAMHLLARSFPRPRPRLIRRARNCTTGSAGSTRRQLRTAEPDGSPARSLMSRLEALDLTQSSRLVSSPRGLRG